MGACSVGAAACARLLIGAKAEIYTKVSAGERVAGDTALNFALKAYSQPTDDRMKAGARACALMLLECSPGFGDKDSFIFSSEHAMDLVSCCAPMELHGHLCGHGLLPAVELLLSTRVDPNVAYDYNSLIRDRVANDEGEADGLLFETGSLLPLVVSCSMGSSPEVVLALLAAGAKPKPALNAARNPRFDRDGQSSKRLELITHATRTRKLHGKAVQVEGLESRPELNGCRGTIAGVWAGLGQWPVLLVAHNKVISLKCENVVLLPKDERQDPACKDREVSPLAISTTALEDSTASGEDDDGQVPNEDDKGVVSDDDAVLRVVVSPVFPSGPRRIDFPAARVVADADEGFLSCDAVDLLRIDRDDECLYRSVLAALRDMGHHQSIFTVRRLRKLVHEGCQSSAARKIQIGPRPLLEHLQVQHKTLSDLAHRTTLRGRDGWAGIEEAAVLASQLKVVIEIWVASPLQPGYVLWFRASGASSKATGVARLCYNGTNHYDLLRVRQPI
jgi:hypothetical protein